MLDGSGERLGGEIGLAARIAPGLGLVAMLGGAEFEADRPGGGYDEASVSLDLTADLPMGMRLLGSAGLREIDFDAGREDDEADLYIGLQAPLNIGGTFDDLSVLDGLGLQTGVRHRTRRSTAAGLDGDDTALEVLLTREFLF